MNYPEKTIDWIPDENKRICTECKTVFHADELVKHFYQPGNEWWIVCPHCHTPEHILVVCYYPGCKKEAPCGTPTTTGYVFTCGKHAPE